MQDEGYTVSCLHGDLLPEERDRVMDEFRKGSAKVLIATNVLSRGIDVLQVSLVINFDLPTDEYQGPDLETYLHRIGRTGRFGRVRGAGAALSSTRSRSRTRRLGRSLPGAARSPGARSTLCTTTTRCTCWSSSVARLASPSTSCRPTRSCWTSSCKRSARRKAGALL